MSDNLVTRCPHCQTRFRVNASQLVAAGGAVRCGACMAIFDATAQLTGQPAESSAAEAAGPALLPAPSAETVEASETATEDETLWIHDDMDLADLGLEDLDLEAEMAQLTEPTPADSDEAPDEPQEPQEPEEVPREEVVPAPLPVAPLPARRQPLVARRDTGDRPNRKGGARPAASSGLELAELEDEPINLDWRPARKPWGRWLLWSLFNLLALTALAGQYVAYHFEELARQDRYRPWFESLCPSLGCELPSRVDIAQLRSSNLLVRSHPEFTGALAVDAIIYNRAEFPQPFPLLELRFADLSGKLIASRRFKPSEYLAGELAGRDEMPPQVPIHISLSILDPGPRAVNYSLSFQSPE